MKKILISIFPICALLFVLLWISSGLNGVLILFAVLLSIVTAFGFAKWVEFVDEHIKD